MERSLLAEMENAVMERFAYSVLALTLALIALPSGAAAATTTLDNLQAGFNGESNAHSRYLAFAEKADQEGYGEVASLFRAAAKAEEVHAANHAAVIKKMGGTAQAKIETPVVKSTKENLDALAERTQSVFGVLSVIFLALLAVPGVLKRSNTRLTTTILPLGFLVLC